MKLTDEQIQKAKKSLGGGGVVTFDDRDSALAQIAWDEAIKWVVEWGNKPCISHPHVHLGQLPKVIKQHECSECWQELKKEAK